MLAYDKFSFAAADGFRLAVQHGSLANPVESDVTVIIPARTLNEIARLIGDQSDSVEIMMTPSKGQIMFRTQTVEVVSQLLQGQFPNYEQLIPQTYETRAIFDLPDLLRATRTAGIFARDGSNIVRMQVTPAPDQEFPGKVIISACPKKRATRSDGFAPCDNQYFIRSSLRVILFSLSFATIGSYVPRRSINRPSRGLRESATTMR